MRKYIYSFKYRILSSLVVAAATHVEYSRRTYINDNDDDSNDGVEIHNIYSYEKLSVLFRV